MDSVCLEIGLNSQHVSETNQLLRYQLICDKQWLQTLEKKRKIGNFPSYPKLDKRAHPDGDLEHPWCRILLQLYKKQPNVKVYPLKSSGLDAEDNGEFANCMPLSYSQAVYNVMSTNFKNLWEDFYRKCPEAHLKSDKYSKQQIKMGRSPSGSVAPYDVVLKELIMRVYKCPVIHCKLDRLRDESADITTEEEGQECHTNIMSALVAIETSSYFAVFFYPPCISTSLYDCITFSPAILTKNYNKSLFLVYQLIQLYKYFHNQGLYLGDIYLQDILLNENLWILLVPNLEANMIPLYMDEIVSHSPSEAAGHQDLDYDRISVEADRLSVSNLKLDLKFSYDLKQFSLRDYCEMWCNGLLSNYDYLTILNNAAGRSLTNPSYHHIMPWVTDFSSKNGANWRDLSKSKYRLNKGDIHLDLMFQHAAQQSHKELDLTYPSNTPQIPHHVSDFLSEITYFVYMARRTPQHILREHVRPIWVPAEYPASIQRLQEWTPDECIPEFYSDPMIFKSIHEDLPDLEIPSWASCPEDFICKHREALESQYVSERLHHWIDLNFGCKLSGKAAIKSKNVCLTMVDQHKNLCQRGIVQLFTHAHPAKRTSSIWFNKTAPRIQNLFPPNDKKIQKPLKSRNHHHNKETTRLAKSTENLNKSSESLDIAETKSTNSSKTSPRLSLKISSNLEENTANSNFYKSTNFIELPKDFNPCAQLQSLEMTQQFIAKTFPLQKPTENAQEKVFNSDLLFEDYSENHSFTNQLFNEISPTTSTSSSKPKSKLLTTKLLPTHPKIPSPQHSIEKRLQDLQILGCLILEIFAFNKLRPLIGNNLTPKFEERLKACLTILSINKHDIPKCLRSTINQLLNLNISNIITENGLPLPSAQQLLEPIYHNLLIPFPSNYYPAYALIRSLQSFDFASILLELHTHFHCNGLECGKYAEIDRMRVLYERKIAKCKVMSCCAHIRRLLDPIGYEQFPSIDLLLPHIIDLLTQEHTSILAAWNIFDAVAQSLGVIQTQKLLLQPLMKLYDVESFERGMTSVRNRSISESITSTTGHLRFSTSSSFKSRKSVKLYHQIFLLRLMVRFGLKCFLNNFIAPLIEAVGGYKEPEDGNGLHYHSAVTSRRTSKNLSYVTNAGGNDDDLTLISPQKAEDLDDNTLSLDIDGKYVQEFFLTIRNSVVKL